MATLGSPFSYNPTQQSIPSLQQFLGGGTTPVDLAGSFQVMQRDPTGFQPPKTDTGGTLGGGTWSAPSTQVPYTAPSTTGGGTGAKAVSTIGGAPAPTGGAWNLPEWAYGGNQKGASTYNKQTGQWDPTGTVAAGSDVFGAKIPVGYDPRQDRGGLNLSGNNVETFWSKFLRLTNDMVTAARRNGQSMTAEQAMQATLTRLRNDNGGTLQGTGFSDAGPTSTLTQPSQLPGSALPGQTPQTIRPDGSVAHGTPGGGVGGTPAGGVPAGGITGGGAGGSLAETQRQYLIDDPEYALRYMLKQRGIDVDQKGLVGSYMRSKYLNPLKAAIAATGLGTGGSQLGDIESVLARFGSGLQGHGNELENFLHGIAQRANENPALNDLSDQDLMALEENLGFLGTFGTNDYVASARKNQYDDVKQGFGDLFFGGLQGGEMPSFNEYMRQRNYRPY